MTFVRAFCLVAALLGAGDAVYAQRPPPPAEASNSQLIAVTAEAAVGCAVAASAAGVDMTRLAGDEWNATEAPRGYRHADHPVVISLVPASNDQPESCAVESTLASQYDQTQLVAALRVLLPGQPTEERGGLLWRIGRAGNGRTLFMVTDQTSPQPVIRFTGIGF